MKWHENMDIVNLEDGGETMSENKKPSKRKVAMMVIGIGGLFVMFAVVALLEVLK